MNDFILLESKEGRTKRMLKSKGYDPQKIINSVKHDFSQLEHSSRPAYKFLYGVCRMVTDNEFTNAGDIATMNNILKTISIEPHLSEYNDNLNDLSKDEIFRRFLPLIYKENKDTLNKLKHMKFNEPSDYEIVKIDNFQQASKFAKYTPWCVTQHEKHFDSYSNDGINQFYFCLKKGFEKVQKNNIDAPLNEYGLSMISVCVDYNGMPLYITTRYNHDFDGENNENLCTPEQLVEILKVNYVDTFKPSKKGERMNKYNIETKLESGENINNLFDKVTKYSDNLYSVVLDKNNNIIYKNKLLFDWENIKCGEIKCIGEENNIPIIDIKGDFSIKKYNGKSLASLFRINHISGNFYCSYCDSLESLEGAPQEVGGNFYCSDCPSLTSLKGAPQKVGGNFSCSECTSLTSLEGAPQEVGGDFYCRYCDSLESLKGAPQKVGRDFDCVKCPLLTSLQGAPQKVGRSFICNVCSSLTSLEGAPQEVGVDFSCRYCTLLESLEDSPQKVGRDFDCHGCTSLTSLKGAPQEVGGDFICSYCTSLESLKGAPQKVGGDFICRSCTSLKSHEGAPKKGR